MPKGGVPPPWENHFPTEFCNEICTIYVRAIKNYNSAKKKKTKKKNKQKQKQKKIKMLFRFKMVAK